MTKFIHIREFGEDGLEIETKGGKTIAYLNWHGTIRFAVAKCSDSDNFCRKTGRIIATGRLSSAKHTREIQKQEGQTDYEAIMGAL